MRALIALEVVRCCFSSELHLGAASQRWAAVRTHQIESGAHGFDEGHDVVVQAFLNQIIAVAAGEGGS
jgi:hypothetical protein